MAKKKEAYLKANQDFLDAVRLEEGTCELRGGVFYKKIKEGRGEGVVTPRSIVSCYYRGSLINGKVFDDTFGRGYPEAFRVCELINGFQIALVNMHIGDRWQVYIPSEMGYGPKGDKFIPGGSTLIFDIELVSIG